MEPYVKTGYMLEQAFHTLTNIDFFIQGIHLHKLKAAIYEEKLAVLEVLGAFGHVRLLAMSSFNGKLMWYSEEDLGFLKHCKYSSQQIADVTFRVVHPSPRGITRFISFTSLLSTRVCEL